MENQLVANIPSFPPPLTTLLLINLFTGTHIQDKYLFRISDFLNYTCVDKKSSLFNSSHFIINSFNDFFLFNLFF